MTITLEIGKLVVSESPPKDIFTINVELMHGDGDHYNNIVFKAENKEKAIKFIDLFDRMKNEYPNGRAGGDDFDHLEGFEELVGDKWPWDITSNCDMQADIIDYMVFYYNEDGIKHNVEVKRGQ